MRSAFGIEHGDEISKAGFNPVAGVKAAKKTPTSPTVKKPKAPKAGDPVPTPDPSRAGAAAFLARNEVKRNPLSYAAGAGAAGAAGGYVAGNNRNKYRGY